MNSIWKTHKVLLNKDNSIMDIHNTHTPEAYVAL